MATNTYVALDKVTLGSNGGTVTFTNIPQTYTDLCLVINGGFVDNGFAFGIRVGNGSVDTGSNYSFTWVKGNGSTANSGRGTNFTLGVGIEQGANNLNNTAIVNFMNYSNTTTYKTWITKGGNAADNAGATVNLWRSTAAINTIAISESGTGGSGSFNYGNMLAGTTFSLYGIKAWADEVTPKATGGYVYEDSNYWYHTFLSSGTFTPNQSLTCDYLVVAGGGAGSGDIGGAGGAGGLRSTVGATGGGGSLESPISVTAQAYAITVGAGGAGVGPTTNSPGSNGSNSVFSTITATGGGGGGPNTNNTTGIGNTGGSGGGAGEGESNRAAGTANQGYAGGAASNASAYGTGGGGGAGAVGADGTTTAAGNGGIGVAISALATVTKTGVNGYYAGGGGGSAHTTSASTFGTGGLGGGGNGGYYNTSTLATPGIANTGGGAGGGAANTGVTPAGGSGIVIVRYAK